MFCSSLRTGKVNSFGWLRYSGFVRHKEPLLDAVGALADLLVFTFNMTGLDVLQKIEAQTLAGNFCYLQPTTSSRVNHGRPHSISCAGGSTDFYSGEFVLRLVHN